MSVFEPGWPKILTIYNVSSGRIRMTGTFRSPADANEHTEEGEAWLEGHADVRSHVVNDGAIEEKTVNKSALVESQNRELRLVMLTESDWTQLPDNGLTEEQKALWRTYRQKLRDLSDHVNWPDLEEFDWPSKP